MKKKKKQTFKLPKKIVVIPNLDKKGWTEKWTKNRDLLDFPCPSRVLFCSNPSCGKTNLIKNCILHAKKEYDDIYLCHYDPETIEYDDMDVTPLDSIPNPGNRELFNRNKKTALIIDDRCFKNLSKKEFQYLDRLWGHTSSHHRVNLFLACQYFYSLPVIIRSMSNVFFIWKGCVDNDSLKSIGRKMGLKKEEFKRIFDLCKTKYDNLCFDFTDGSPAPIRLNGYQIVKKKNDS